MFHKSLERIIIASLENKKKSNKKFVYQRWEKNLEKTSRQHQGRPRRHVQRLVDRRRVLVLHHLVVLNQPTTYQEYVL